MSGAGVTWLFSVPLAVSVAMVFSEELFKAWLWLMRIHIGRVDEAFMPPFVAVVFPSGRQWRLWVIRVKEENE